MSPFAPSLQLPWSLVEVRAPSFNRVVVRVAARERKPFANPLGQHVGEISAAPEITAERVLATFQFDAVLFFRMCWEIADPDLGDTASEFRGDTFRWYLQSPLIRQQRDRTDETRAAQLRHYQLVCEELIDIVCSTAPKVLFHASNDAPPMA